MGKESSNKMCLVLGKLLEWVITGMVFAIAASLLSSYLLSRQEQKHIIQEQLDNLSSIYIGCNKEWMDEKFGAPQFSGEKDGYALYAYVSDYFVVQAAFGYDNATKAYLITALECDDAPQWVINDGTFSNTNLITHEGMKLGSFSYDACPGKPEKAIGGVSNGVARAIYAESYYFMSLGNYYNYYFATLDYGKLPGTVQDFAQQLPLIVDYSFKSDEDDFEQIADMRRDLFPNSYGVSELEVNVNDLLFSYDWFNSAQIRNRMIDPSDIIN